MATDLGNLPGGGRAEAINNSGDIVGYSDGRAFRYSGGTMTDLNDLLPANSGWVLGTAYDVNDYGPIVGTGQSGRYA